MKASTKKIESLKQKQAQLQAQIESLEAAEKNRERKRETRRKILIGAYYLDQARTKDQMGDLQRAMDTYLKRNADRVLFDLPSLAVPETTTSAAKTKATAVIAEMAESKPGDRTAA